MDRQEELQNKYRAAFDAIHDKGVRLTHVHIQDNKLFVQGAAPSEEAKNEVWNQIKAADPSYGDLTCDLKVDPSLAPSQSAAASAGGGSASAEIQAGQNLTKPV